MLAKRLHKRFWLARTWFALSLTYAAGFILAAFFIVVSTGPETVNYQRAFLLNSSAVILLWVGLIIARPKPDQPRTRSVFAAFEYLLVGLVFSLALVLFSHHGWHMSASAPAGFAAIAWGVGYIAAWLGPMVIGVLALLLGHWMWLNVFLDYRSACWQFVREAYTAAMLSELEVHLQEDGFLRTKDAQYVGRKLIQWQLSTPWKPFELDLPSSATHLHAPMLDHGTNQQTMLTLEKRSAVDQNQVIQSITLMWPDEKSVA